MCDNFYDEIEKALKDEETYNNERYDADDIMLKNYVDVEKIKPHNLEYIYFISTLINSCYSTRMGADRLLATAKLLEEEAPEINNILNKEALDNKDLKFIDGICNQKIEGVLGGVKFRSYSFITKFLKIHDKYGKTRKIFPIYDGNVIAVIKEYKLNEIEKLETIITNSRVDNKQKKNANNILEELREIFSANANKKVIDFKNYVLFYKIMSILTIVLGTNFHDLDQAFWKLGKDILDEQRKEKKRKEKKRKEKKEKKE